MTLVSQDVIHGFYVPEFNFSRYAQPGVTNQFDLTPEASSKPKDYRGQCTQLCGLYHALMFFHVTTLPPAQFQAVAIAQLRPELHRTVLAPSGERNRHVVGIVGINVMNGEMDL